MAIITRKELTELCNDIRTNIDVWIGRGKIITVEGSKKYIDTDNEINALFIQQRQDAYAQKLLLGEGIKQVKINNQKPKDIKITIDTKIPKKAEKIELIPMTKPIVNDFEPTDQNSRATQKINQEAKIRQQKIDLAELKIQSEKIRLDKTAGNLLPIDLGMGVIERHTNSILKTFEKGFERIADVYANFAGLEHGARTDFIKECRVELSRCIELAGKSAQGEIDILVDNYAETLMVGQKKA